MAIRAFFLFLLKGIKITNVHCPSSWYVSVGLPRTVEEQAAVWVELDDPQPSDWWTENRQLRVAN